MRYFTGKYQGNIPVLSNDATEAYKTEDAGGALHIARLLTVIYGVNYIALPNDENTHLLIERA